MEPRKIFSLTEATQLDGVYIYEIDPPKFVKGIGTGIVGIVGEFEKGPVGEVVHIGSNAQFNQKLGGYGAAPTGQELTWRGYSGFRAVSGKIWPAGLRIVRVERTNMEKATVVLNLATDRKLTVTAKDKGAYGNRIAYTLEENELDDTLFDLTVTLDGDSETIARIDPDITQTQLLAHTTELRLVDLVIADLAPEGVATVLPASGNLASGSDGDADVAANWTAAIDKLLATRECNILFTAEPDGTTVTYNAINAYIKSVIEPTFTLAILSGESAQTAAEAAADASSYRTDRIVYTWPWRKQAYPEASPTHADGILDVPSASAVASALANIDPVYDPASYEGARFINSCTVGLEFDGLSRDDYVTANKGGLCSLEFDPDIGYRVVTGITTSLVAGKEMIHRRRLADFLTMSVAKFLKYYQNQPITEDWKEEITGAIDDFLDQMKTLVPVPYVIKSIVDIDSVNTEETEAQGIFKILMKVKTPASARFIVLLSQIGSTVKIEEKEA